MNIILFTSLQCRYLAPKFTRGRFIKCYKDPITKLAFYHLLLNLHKKIKIRNVCQIQNMHIF